jgi:hypothetical protein
LSIWFGGEVLMHKSTIKNQQSTTNRQSKIKDQ